MGWLWELVDLDDTCAVVPAGVPMLALDLDCSDQVDSKLAESVFKLEDCSRRFVEAVGLRPTHHEMIGWLDWESIAEPRWNSDSLMTEMQW